MSAQTILLVDDEPSILQLSRMYLEREGFEIQSADDGLQALQAIERLKPALLVLDVMLPGLDGFEVCRRLRAANNPLPIIMLTARDEDIDKILGLELGADDYLTKPFNPRELVARVKAILRRGSMASERRVESVNTLSIGNITIEPERRMVRVAGKPVDLRMKEFDLLWTLARDKGMVFSREKLLEIVWGYDFAGETRTVDVHIAHLRHKLQGMNAVIETVWGVGYKLDLP